LDKFKKLIERCRENVRYKSQNEKDDFLINSFKMSITTSSGSSSSINAKFDHDFKLHSGENVCRSGWQILYGFSKDRIELCSTVLKAYPDATSLKHTCYKNEVPPYCYSQVEEIMFSNLEEYGS
jgi:hypothetical protein